MEKTMKCSRCSSQMEFGHLAPPGDIAVFWAGPKTGMIKRKSAKVFAYRCSDCGMIQLESELYEKK